MYFTTGKKARVITTGGVRVIWRTCLTHLGHTIAFCIRILHPGHALVPQGPLWRTRVTLGNDLGGFRSEGLDPNPRGLFVTPYTTYPLTPLANPSSHHLSKTWARTTTVDNRWPLTLTLVGPRAPIQFLRGLGPSVEPPDTPLFLCSLPHYPLFRMRPWAKVPNKRPLLLMNIFVIS